MHATASRATIVVDKSSSRALSWYSFRAVSFLLCIRVWPFPRRLCTRNSLISINRVARNNTKISSSFFFSRADDKVSSAAHRRREEICTQMARHARRRTKKASVRKPRLRPPPCSSRCRSAQPALALDKAAVCKRKATPLRKTPLKSCAREWSLVKRRRAVCS